MATTLSSSSVVAFFSNEAQSTEAIDALKSAGFKESQIGAATSDGSASATTGASYDTDSSYANAGAPPSTTGAKAEGMWGKVKNFFEGDHDGQTGAHTTTGGVEQYADERTHDNASHEITRGGYADSNDGYYEAGDVSHSLSGMSVPQEHTRYFEHRLSTEHSGMLVTVTAPGREEEAAAILERSGGDLGAAASSYDYGTAADAAPAAGQQRIQLLGEVLRVHKDRISRGEVRIHKETITEQQTVQVPVTREELVIERIPVSGQTAVHGAIGENDDIRIPLSEERASLDKQTVVREEVSVGKRAIDEVQEVGGNVRHEELQVEDETTRTR